MRPISCSSRSRRVFSAALALVLAAALWAPASAEAKKDKKARPGKIVGKVMDQTEETLAGVQIEITLAGDPDFSVTETTDKRGEFETKITGHEGTFTIHLEKEGFDPFDAEVELYAGNVQEITFRLVEVGANNPYLAVEANNAGIKAYQEQDLEAALAKFEEATDLDDTLYQPYLFLADIHRRAGRMEEAGAAIDRFLAEEPEMVQANELAYEIHSQLGNAERSEAALAKLAGTEAADNLARRIYNAGVAADREGDVDGAIRLFETAAGLAPDLTAVHQGMSAVLFNRQRWDEALVALDRLLELDPENVSGRRMRWLSLAATDQSGAEAALDAYAEVAPDAAAEVIAQQAATEFRGGRAAQAKALASRALDLTPDLPQAVYTMGLVRLSEGDVPAGRALLERFLELAPNDPEAETARRMLAGL